jgi:hypothetical protein
VLVRTRDRNWLLIKHRDEFVSTDDLTLTKPLSVVSRRTLAGIARAAGASPRQLEAAAAADPPRPARAAAAAATGTPPASPRLARATRSR